MSSAILAELSHFEALGILFAIFLGSVISLFAFIAGKSNTNAHISTPPW